MTIYISVSNFSFLIHTLDGYTNKSIMINVENKCIVYSQSSILALKQTITPDVYSLENDIIIFNLIDKRYDTIKTIAIKTDTFEAHIATYLTKICDLSNHPMGVSLNYLFSSIDINSENHSEVECKVKAIFYIINVNYFSDEKNLFFKIKSIIFKQIFNREKVTLDSLSAHFFVSRRKMQYILSKNNITFLKLVNGIKVEVALIKKNLL